MLLCLLLMAYNICALDEMPKDMFIQISCMSFNAL
jgi:hypothetical protein